MKKNDFCFNEGEFGNDSDLYSFVGTCFEKGLRFAKNHSIAIDWYCEGVKRGSGNAAYRLALLLGKNSTKWKRVAKLYAFAGDQGVSKAYVNLGVLLEQGKRLWMQQSSHDWYRKAHKCGNPLGTFNLGRCFYLGIGVNADKHKAKTFFVRAAQRMRKYSEIEDFQRPMSKCIQYLSEIAEKGQVTNR